MSLSTVKITGYKRYQNFKPEPNDTWWFLVNLTYGLAAFLAFSFLFSSIQLFRPGTEFSAMFRFQAQKEEDDTFRHGRYQYNSSATAT